MGPGNRLRAMRKAAGLTQMQLAEQTGVSQPAISQLENGTLEMSFSWARTFARVLKCRFVDLLDDDDAAVSSRGLLADAARWFSEFYGKLRFRHELSIVSRQPDGTSVVAIDRTQCDFAKREQLLVDLVVPHFWRALHHAEERTVVAAAPTASVPLTARETEILEHVATGATNDAIGRLLGISPRTVQAHLANAFEKLGTRSRAGATAWLLRTRETSSSASVAGC
jgi:DNA-binding CsgD family transcriptional regulator/transcriptional regulator with XRE-family HTH domain